MNRSIIIRIGLACLISLLLPTMACKKKTADVGVSQTEEVESILEVGDKWTGDFDGMVKRKKIRVLVPYSKTFYFLDGAKQSGITYEMVKIFDEWLNKKLGKKHLRVHLVIIPTPSENLLTGAPTIGFGETRPHPRSASARARRM